MDEFFCRTRFFWAFTRMLFSVGVFYDLFQKSKEFGGGIFTEWYNVILMVYALVFFFISINEFRAKETNRALLLITGLLSLIVAVGLVGLTIGNLKEGHGFLLFFLFLWLVIIGLKDVLGNHFYIE